MQIQSTPQGAAVAVPVPRQKRRARNDLITCLVSVALGFGLILPSSSPGN